MRKRAIKPHGRAPILWEFEKVNEFFNISLLYFAIAIYVFFFIILYIYDSLWFSMQEIRSCKLSKHSWLLTLFGCVLRQWTLFNRSESFMCCQQLRQSPLHKLFCGSDHLSQFSFLSPIKNDLHFNLDFNQVGL